MDNILKMPTKTLERLAIVLAPGTEGRKAVIKEILKRKKSKKNE